MKTLNLLNNLMLINFLTLILTLSLINGLSPLGNSQVTTNNSVKVFNNDELLYRLPDTILPTLYNLELTVDLQQFIFSGNVKISIYCSTTTNKVMLHSKNIVVNWNLVTLIDVETMNQITFINFEENPITDITTIIFNNDLIAGKNYIITLDMSGIITDEPTGLYRSSYIKNGNVRYIATTQFQSTYARQVFPCFDEPHFKAKFQVNVYSQEGYTVLTNMPPVAKVGPIQEKEGFYLNSFDVTPFDMSTYLLAIVISDLQPYTANGFIHVYLPGNNIEEGRYSAEFAEKSLKKLEEFVGREYQLEKIDFVSVPDFTFGAMENWGLIIFRDPYLTYNEKTMTRIHQSGTNLITHELVHMWFGNEVTPEWWDYIWLSEGFARYLEYYITDKLKPEWKLMEQYIVTNIQNAMAQDDKISSRPIQTTGTYDQNEINNLFDYVVYDKSSAILRMFQNAITMPVFQKAVQKYLSNRSFLTATPEDLYTALQDEVNTAEIILPADVATIFNIWTKEPGYQVININTLEKEHILTHQRFIMNPDDVPAGTNPLHRDYYLPINYVTSKNVNFNDTTFQHWLLAGISGINLELNLEDENDWYLLNKQVTSFYRVNYDLKNWNALIKFLKLETNYTTIDVANRAQLVDDAANLAKAGQLDYNIFLDLSAYLEHETDYIPWAAASNAFTHLSQIMRGSSEADRIELFIQKIGEPVYENLKLTANNLGHIERLHQMSISKLVCSAGAKQCINDANELIANMISDTNYEIREEIQVIVFCTISRHSTIYQNFLLERFLTLMITGQYENIDLIYRMASGVGCTKNSTKIEEFLKWTTINLPVLMPADRRRVFNDVASGSYIGTKAAIEYMDINFLALRTALESLTTVFETIGRNIVSAELNNAFNSLIEVHASKFTPEDIIASENAVKLANQNLLWLERNQEKINNWLVANTDRGAASLIVFKSILILLPIFLSRLLS